MSQEIQGEEDDSMTDIEKEIDLEEERRNRGVSRNTLLKQLHRGRGP